MPSPDRTSAHPCMATTAWLRGRWGWQVLHPGVAPGQQEAELSSWQPLGPWRGGKPPRGRHPTAHKGQEQS